MSGSGFGVFLRCALWFAGVVVTLPAMADASSFLAEAVAAHGGGKAPLALHERGVTTSMRRGEGAVERWWQAPDRFRIEIRYANGEESRLLNGAQAWQQGRPASVPFHGALVLQAARIALPWRLLDNAAQVVDLGLQNVEGGVAARVVEWPLQPGMKIVAEFDPASRLLLRSRGILTLAGASMEFATRYESYTPVEGRLVALVEQHFAMGQFIGTTRLESVSFAAVLPAPTFSAPPLAAVPVR